MGLFGGGNSSSVFAPDQRQWFDSYNVATNPTLAVSDLGKVTVQVNQPAPAGPVAATLAGLDPRWLLTFGLLVLVALVFKPFR
jgi:hypothetical protein